MTIRSKINLPDYFTFKTLTRLKLSDSPLTCASSSDSIAAVCDMNGSVWLISEHLKFAKCEKFTNSTIFDCLWTSNVFIFASGSGTISVCDPNRTKYRLIDFDSPIRCVANRDENIIYVGFFGGRIHQIDLREKNPNQNGLLDLANTKFLDKDACETKSHESKTRCTSVTSLLSPRNCPYILFSAHAPGGMIRKWDTRYTRRYLKNKNNPLFVYRSSSAVVSQFPVISMFYDENLYCLSDKVSVFNESLDLIKNFKAVGYMKFGKIIKNHKMIFCGSSGVVQIINPANLACKQTKFEGVNGLFYLKESAFLYTDDGQLHVCVYEFDDYRYCEFELEIFRALIDSKYRII